MNCKCQRQTERAHWIAMFPNGWAPCTGPIQDDHHHHHEHEHEHEHDEDDVDDDDDYYILLWLWYTVVIFEFDVFKIY